MTETTPKQTASSIPMTQAQLAAQLQKDLGLAGAPPALADTVEALQKILIQQSEDNARLQVRGVPCGLPVADHSMPRL